MKPHLSLFGRRPLHDPHAEAAHAYDAVGQDYRDYADGEAHDLFAFDGRYSFADREIWSRIDASLIRLLSTGQRTLHILDAGCGPGTWLLRVIHRARELGFGAITARGFDISAEMIALAQAAAPRARGAGVKLRFEVADLADALDDDEAHAYDIVLCLYGVLNHLILAEREAAAASLARVAGGDLFVTVRTVGSRPTIYVANIESARSFKQDNRSERLDVDLLDGRHLSFCSHLFTADELLRLFTGHLEERELVGLDMFHGRFTPDPRWNPATADDLLGEGLVRLEHLCNHDPAFMDHAAHVLLHAAPRRGEEG
jgi:SAM-dependent methyltransferase